MASESGPPDIGMPEVEVPDGPESKPSGFTETEKQEMMKFTKNASPFLVAGLLFAVTFMSLVLSDWIDFNTTGEELPDIQSRIGYVLKYSSFGAMWVLVCLMVVGIKRSLSPAMDPTSGNDQYVQSSKNILNNSFEQFMLALVSQLILVQHLDGEHTLNYIPALAFLFILGRITFWLGYPKYRLFGFFLNVTPLFFTMCYNL